MVNRSIVFIDSGVGGLPYLEMAKNFMPEENFIYIADTENFPYGEKKAELLQEIIIKLIDRIVISFSPKLIVIACNTASVVALSLLREKFGIPFVGVVPAIKPAAENRGNGSIGLLATRKTIDDPYTDSLIEKYASGIIIEKYAGIKLVDFVENRYFSSTEEAFFDIVSESVRFFTSRKISVLVLGCTHFIYLAEYFEKSLGNSVLLIDSREGVTKQIKRILMEENIAGKGSSDNFLYITKLEGNETRYKQFSNKFNLKWGGVL